MVIGATYRRHFPDGRETELLIKNQAEKEYHEDLAKNGFVYVALDKPVGVCTAREA